MISEIERNYKNYKLEMWENQGRMPMHIKCTLLEPKCFAIQENISTKQKKIRITE